MRLPYARALYRDVVSRIIALMRVVPHKLDYMSNKKRLKIIRGIPGSGKSTYVKRHYPKAIVCSADNYFEGLAKANNTSYLEEFKGWLIGRAHQHCWALFILAVVTIGVPLVVVDNTNIAQWEYMNYVLLAETMGYDVEIVEIPFEADKAEVYYERNTHGVPLNVIQDMISRYEP